jgi:hypothetical protein
MGLPQVGQTAILDGLVAQAAGHVQGLFGKLSGLGKPAQAVVALAQKIQKPIAYSQRQGWFLSVGYRISISYFRLSAT